LNFGRFCESLYELLVPEHHDLRSPDWDGCLMARQTQAIRIAVNELGARQYQAAGGAFLNATSIGPVGGGFKGGTASCLPISRRWTDWQSQA
jgi:hypothetical protein